MITFRPHKDSVSALAFSADGTALASVSYDRWVRVWEVSGLAHQALRWEAEASNYSLTHCQFSADGTELFTGGSDGTVRVWRTTDGKLLRSSEPDPFDPGGHTAIFAFVLSRDGRYVAWCGHTMGGAESQITVADTQTLTVSHRIPAHESDAMILAAYPDGFCSGAKDRTVKFWDWRTPTCHGTVKLRGTVRALALSPHGNRVALAGVTTVAVRHRAGHGVAGEAVHLRGHAKCIECVEFSPDGSRLASASTDGTLRLWDTASGACVRTLALKLGPLHWVSYAPDGLTLAFSSLKGDLGLIDLDD